MTSPSSGKQLPNRVAQSIKTKREQMNLSARNVSLQANLSPSYVAKVEKGEIEPSLRAFSSIAVVLNFSSAEILHTVRMEALANFADRVPTFKPSTVTPSA